MLAHLGAPGSPAWPKAAKIVTMAAVRHVSRQERRWRLARRHLLADDTQAPEVATVADALVALHSSDPASVYLSCWPRLAAPSRAAVERALYEQRSVLRHHAMRRTIWVFTPAVARLAHASCTTALAATEWRRLARLIEESNIAADGAAWVRAAKAEALAVLADAEPVSARQFGELLPSLRVPLQLAPGKPYAGTQNAHSRLLQNLGFDGSVLRGPPTGSWISAEYLWSPASKWHPEELAGLDRAAASAALTQRYLEAFGPASTADVQWWSGWSGATTKAALAAAGAVRVTVDGGDGWLAAGDDDTAEPVPPWVALLPSLDPTVMGWKERTWYLGELGTFGGPLFDRNGNAGPTVWVNGEVVGGWAQRPTGEIAFRLFAAVGADHRRAIEAKAAELSLLIGNERVRGRFPVPLQRELLA